MISGIIQTSAYGFLAVQLIKLGRWRTYPCLLALVVAWSIQGAFDIPRNLALASWWNSSWQPREYAIIVLVVLASVEILWRFTYYAAERLWIRLGALAIGYVLGASIWHFYAPGTLDSHDPPFHIFLLARQAVWCGAAIALLSAWMYMRNEIWTDGTAAVIMKLFTVILIVHAGISSFEHHDGAWFTARVAYRATVALCCALAAMSIDPACPRSPSNEPRSSGGLDGLPPGGNRRPPTMPPGPLPIAQA